MELDFTMDDLSVGAARLHCFCSRALVLYDVFVETAASGITLINGVSGWVGDNPMQWYVVIFQ